MILSFDPAAVLATAAVAAYVLSALGRPLGTTGVQALALGLHGLSLALGFFEEAYADQGIRFGFAPVTSLTVWLVLTVHFAESRMMPIGGLRRALSLAGACAVLLGLWFPGDVIAVVRSPYAPVHWALGVAAYGLFGVAVVHALLLDGAERRLRRKDAGHAVLGVPLLALEGLTFKYVEAGFVVLTLAILLGTISLGHGRGIRRPSSRWRAGSRSARSSSGGAPAAGAGARPRGGSTRAPCSSCSPTWARASSSRSSCSARPRARLAEMKPPRSLALPAPRGGWPVRDWRSQIPASLELRGCVRAAAPAEGFTPRGSRASAVEQLKWR